MTLNDLFLAAVSAPAVGPETTLQKLQKIPPAFWLKVGIAVAAVIVIFIVLRSVLKINKFVLGGASFIAAGLIWFNWIYHRNEPKFLTPLVDRIAPFFPAAGAYETKQAGTVLPVDPHKKK
jgi:preprotein translocase subunit Sec61beta